MELNRAKYHFVVYTRELNSKDDKVLFETDIEAANENEAKIKAEEKRKIWFDTAQVKPLYLPLFEKIYPIE